MDQKTLTNLLIEQKETLRTLEHAFVNNKIAHAYLIVSNSGSSTIDFANYFVMSLLCEQHGLACNECKWCKKIAKNSYFDLITLNAKSGEVRKDDLKEIINKFSYTGLESRNMKIYVIHNIEYVTPANLNIILKFLEEPTGEVYAIFSCENVNKVLPTIVSRCQIVRLNGKDKSLLKQSLIEKGLENIDAQLLSEIFMDENEAMDFYNEPAYTEIKDLAYEYVTKLGDEDANARLTYAISQQSDKKLIYFFIDYVINFLKAQKQFKKAQEVMNWRNKFNATTNVNLLINYLNNIIHRK